MKSVVVTDAFMKEEYYRDCYARVPGHEIARAVHFGPAERFDMRDVARNIERNGPYAVEPPEELYEAVEDADILMVHLCPVTRKVLERGKRLKAVLTNRGGLENVDVQAATSLGIPVLSNPAHNANAVAELTIALMLSETRNLARTHANLMRGEWVEYYRNAGRVREIAGSTVGIVGFGNIGRRVARKLTVFDCRVLVYDKYVSPDDPDLAKYGCTFVSLETLLRTSDVVTLHVRAEEQVLGREHFALMKPTAYFINTARPHLIDNEALYERLKDGGITGAAFDVFPKEPVTPDEPLIRLDCVTLSNHRGGDTVNCYSDSPAMLLREFEVMRSGGEPRFWVNRGAQGKSESVTG
ncbi:MAG TPA: 2-hydroxyacid dehydrogenase [Candidatus Limnocylindria bacterium]|nr:2-hydroxyacid dehydrogenase [Candidatus Limnocylindria bacterium]